MGCDRTDQNIATYMINLQQKKWCWPLFRFALDVSVNNPFELCHMRNLDRGERRMDALGFRRAIVDAYFENLLNQRPVLHYTMVIGCSTTLQKIFDTIIVDTGLSKEHKENVHYMNTKEHQKKFVKNVMLDCIKNCFKNIPYSLNMVNKNVCTTVLA